MAARKVDIEVLMNVKGWWKVNTGLNERQRDPYRYCSQDL